MENQYELNVGATPEPKRVEYLLQSNTPPASPLPALLIEDAHFFVEKGCNVIPVTGKKTTVQWAHLQKHRQTLDEINTYDWKAATGLSVILGINDIHSFDIDDVRDDTILFDLLAKLAQIRQLENIFDRFLLEVGDCETCRALLFEKVV